MGGFANLQKKFEKLFPMIDPGVQRQSWTEDEQQAVYRALQLACLYEIAGNLDTIAVEMREQTKVMKINSEYCSG